MPMNDMEQNHCPKVEGNNVDYFQRAQWLRAAVLGANDGLVTVTSLMMGVGSVKEDIKPMLLAGFAGLFAGACSMAIGEFVSVNTQRDIEMAQIMRREKAMKNGGENYKEETETEREQLPNPVQAAFASALAFSVGAVLPLLATAFIRGHRLRLSVVIAVATSALIAFGVVGARVGGTPMVKSATRVLVGGWVAMTITVGLTRLIGSKGLQM
jgi:VIT1/CCC1 family predicted Fe2+/Mn2+ transporter